MPQKPSYKSISYDLLELFLCHNLHFGFFNFCWESVRFLKEYIADHPEQLANAASRGEAANGENPHRPDLVNEVARYSVTSHEN